MSDWSTAVTRQMEIELPFVSAGMGFVAMPPLVAAVSEAGGLGLLGASPSPPEEVRRMIGDVRARTAKPFGVDLIVADTAFGPATTEAQIDVCVDEGVPLVVFFWNPPPQRWVRRLRDAGSHVWIQTGSVRAAIEAVAMGFDGVVAQGAEAGGHNRSTTGLLTLLPAIVDAVDPVPVIAAGGIADGRGAAAALALGAGAVCVGTRLVASEEASSHPEYRRRIVAASVEDVATTRLFGPEWPGEPMRVVRNRVVREWEGRDGGTPPSPDGAPIGRTVLFGQPYAMPKFCSIPPTPDHEGDFDEMCLAAGESAGLVREILPAARIVHDMMTETRDVLARLASPPAGRSHRRDGVHQGPRTSIAPSLTR